jgi:hypothetical protein
MSRRRQTTLLATGVITVAASLAACGSPITANTTWNSLATLTASGNTLVLKGPLVNSAGKAIAKTVFSETCTQIGPIGQPAPAFHCIAVVNTGTRTYAASNDVAGPFGTLQSLATPATAGSITISNLSASPTSKVKTISIYASKGLNGN